MYTHAMTQGEIETLGQSAKNLLCPECIRVQCGYVMYMSCCETVGGGMYVYMCTITLP